MKMLALQLGLITRGIKVTADPDNHEAEDRSAETYTVQLTFEQLASLVALGLEHPSLKPSSEFVDKADRIITRGELSPSDRSSTNDPRFDSDAEEVGG